MPYNWLPAQKDQIQRLELRPHHALGPRGFVSFIAITAATIALPLFTLLGSPVLWALLPFLIGAVAAIWFALRKNQRDRDILEVLTLSPKRIALCHRDAKGREQHWQANPYWVKPKLTPSGGPVPHYLTLTGGPREVELGAFLAPEERISLYQSLQTALAESRAQ